MRLVAATFTDEVMAEQALAEPRERFELRPIDAEVAPLGASEETEGRVVLAGRFREAVLDEVAQLITRRGGEIVSEVDENKAEHPAARAPSGGAGHLESDESVLSARTSTG
jgi:hypothetical protein